VGSIENQIVPHHLESILLNSVMVTVTLLVPGVVGVGDSGDRV
jgi:hypothetical protein